MKPLIIFQFDKMVEICPKEFKPLRNEIFFRPLPNVRLIPAAKELLKLAIAMQLKTMLLAYNDEVFVKESLLTLKICYYFDELLLVDEYFKMCPNPLLCAQLFIAEHFGENILYIDEFNKELLFQLKK